MCCVFRMMAGAVLLVHAVSTPEGLQQSAPAAPAAAVRADPNRERLAALVGDWTVDVTYNIGGRENRGSARMKAERVLDQHFIRQEYTSRIGANPFITLQFLGYDTIRKKFTIVKMDSMDDAMVYADGDLDQAGRVLTFIGQRSDMMTRTTARLRQVLTFVDADHFTLEWYLTGPDGSETRTVTMAHTRAPAAK